MMRFKAGVQSLQDAAAAAATATDIGQKNGQDNTDVDLAAANTTETTYTTRDVHDKTKEI